jgi:hypothetical protein
MLDRMRVRLVVVGAVVAILGVLTPVAGAQAPTVEDRVISLLNAERSERLIVHYGLLQAARGHSQEMARDGAIGHEGADERVNSAAPDPGEFNGAPDDGFGVAAWCENVTYSVGTSADEAAQRIYDAWHRGGAHERCMMDTSRNVGAVGIYYDGESWWATFIAEADSTPPGGQIATPKPRPATPADTTETPRPRASAQPKTDDGAEASAAPASEPADVMVVAPAPPAASTSPEEEVEEGANETAADAPSRPDAEVVEPAPLAADTQHVHAIADSAAVPIAPRPGIGWPEFAAVAAVLSIATVVLRRWFAVRTLPAFGDPPVVVDVAEADVLSRV